MSRFAVAGGGRFVARLFLALVALAAATAIAAESYPTKPVKIVVAFTAGGTTDILARTLAQRLGERLGQTFYIENKPGANGNLGTELAVRSAPDGYTIIIDSVGPIAVNPSLFHLTYDPLVDLVPVVQVADVPNVLVVPASLGVKTLPDLIRYAKSHPGEVNYSSTGVGTTSHLASFLLASRAGFEATHVPYKGAEALKDLLTGRVQFMFATIPSVISQIHAGKLVPLAVSSVRRSRSMPDVPTVAESGFPGFEATSWFGMFAPKGTPLEIVSVLNKQVNEIVVEPAIDKRMVSEGADPVPGPPQQFGDFVRRETEKWRVVVKQTGAQAD